MRRTQTQRLIPFVTTIISYEAPRTMVTPFAVDTGSPKVAGNPAALWEGTQPRTRAGASPSEDCPTHGTVYEASHLLLSHDEDRVGGGGVDGSYGGIVEDEGPEGSQ